MTRIHRASDKRMRDQISRYVTWPTVQSSIGDAQSFTVEEGKQLIVFNELTVDGELRIDGELVLV